MPPQARENVSDSLKLKIILIQHVEGFSSYKIRCHLGHPEFEEA
jgi:hypothetical protein